MDPPPPYFHADGKPDYLPEELKDRQTGEALVRPNWTAALETQLVWYQSWETRFYDTIQANSPIYSQVQMLPGNVAFHMLKTCAFKSLSKRWKLLNKTPTEIVRMKHLARQAQRKNDVSGSAVPLQYLFTFSLL
jgi:hypothetical protein